MAAKPPSPLDEYREKRDFARTAEPEPAAAGGPDEAGGPLSFVVQQHAATRMHYDLRLELDGVLKSWPVPRGPSADPAEKRLAVMTEDHPLDYASFEGVIAKGEYGAGEVIVWDHGTYAPDDGGVLPFDDRAEAQRRLRAELAAGKLSITFRGHRLKGSYTLVKTAQAEDSWLLIKHRDEAAGADRELVAEQRSVISGLTVRDLAGGRLPGRARPFTPASLAALAGVARGELPAAPQPMNATLAKQPFSNPDWIFEPKLDGIRVLATVRRGPGDGAGAAVTLRTRRGLDVTAAYPAVVAAPARQPRAAALFDGEIVAPDEHGVPSFERLQQRMQLRDAEAARHADAELPVVFFSFDLLHLDGFDLTAVPLWQRKDVLRRVVLPGPWLQCVDHFEGDGETAFASATALGLEGVVAKHRESRYSPGGRSTRWLKVKARESDEFVVGGFSAGQGGRAASFGALLLGTHDDSGALRFAGSVGSGFTDATLDALRARLDGLAPAECPFAEPPAETNATGAGVTYVRPELVVEVEFAQWTGEDHLRAPVFMRVREDKAPAEVRRLTSVAAPPAAGAPTGAAGMASAEQTAPSNAVAAVLEQLADEAAELTLEVAGERLAVKNLDKVMWPAVELDGRAQRALTKRDLLRYFATVSPLLLPQLRDRPLTLTRYPNGITGDFFYQKHYPDAPDFVERVTVHADSSAGDQQFLLCNNLLTLLWLGQGADLALHSSLARVAPGPDGHDLPMEFTGSKRRVERSLLNYPDFLLFDLDPYIYSGAEAAGAEPELNRRAWQQTCEVARWLKELLDGASLSSFLKTSGATGLHIYVPVVRNMDYPAVRSVATTFGRFLVQAHPREVTTEWAIERRTGKVFFDANQNARIKNLAAPYSPRAQPGAPVSMPLRWDELAEVYPTDFTILTAPQRIAQLGDLWSGILDAKHDLRGLLDAG